MTNEQVVRALWDALERRDWPRVEALCSPSLVYTLPQSGEVHDRADYLRMGREYPGEWHLVVERLVDGGEWIVTEVKVTFPDRVDCGVTFFRVCDGQVLEMREHWPEPFEVPVWRQAWTKE